MKRTLNIVSASLLMVAVSACSMKGNTGDLVWGGNGGCVSNCGTGGGSKYGTMVIGTRDFGSFKEQLKAASGIDPISNQTDIDPVATGVQTIRSVWDAVNNTLPQTPDTSISAPSIQAAMQLAEAICSANFNNPANGFFQGITLTAQTPSDADIKAFSDRMARVMWREPQASAADVAEMKSLYTTLYAGQATAAQKIRTGWVGLCTVGAIAGSGLEM